MTLAEQLVALHRALRHNEIPHAFGGAIALAYMTHDPRGTSDIDVNIFVPAQEAAPALAALPEGIKQPPGTLERIQRDGQIRLWWEATPIDLFFNNLPVHEDAAENARTVDYDGSTIPVLGPVELATFKMMFDRPRDWGDIAEMLASRTLDVERVKATLTTMLPPDDPRFARLDEVIRHADKGSS